MVFEGDFVLDSEDIPELLSPFILGFKLKDGINTDNSMKQADIVYTWKVNNY